MKSAHATNGDKTPDTDQSNDEVFNICLAWEKALPLVTSIDILDCESNHTDVILAYRCLVPPINFVSDVGMITNNIP